jgi:hypothetical protein
MRFHLVYECDLPENSFLVSGDEHNVPCVFQVWEKRVFDRPIVSTLTPENFVFVKKIEAPDISFRRVGVNAGIVSTDIIPKSHQSHYFIRFTNGKTIQENLDRLSTITFEFDNTVGPKSISKQELISRFNSVLGN